MLRHISGRGSEMTGPFDVAAIPAFLAINASSGAVTLTGLDRVASGAAYHFQVTAQWGPQQAAVDLTVTVHRLSGQCNASRMPCDRSADCGMGAVCPEPPCP